MKPKALTFKSLARELTKREGKKIGVNIAQMSEILDCLIDMIIDDPTGTLKALADLADVHPDCKFTLQFKPYLYVAGPKRPKKGKP